MHSESIERGDDWIITYTGKKFWPLDPRPEDIDILDIAHHLSNICRFTGAVRGFFSVAQHSFGVSLLSFEHELYGLLHDASEAYLCDISTPVKRSKEFEEYRVAERWLQGMILAVFGIREPACPEIVKKADTIMGVIEGRALMPDSEDAFWSVSNAVALELNTLMPPIPLMPPELAENVFLERFYELTNKNSIA